MHSIHNLHRSHSDLFLAGQRWWKTHGLKIPAREPQARELDLRKQLCSLAAQARRKDEPGIRAWQLPSPLRISIDKHHANCDHGSILDGASPLPLHAVPSNKFQLIEECRR